MLTTYHIRNKDTGYLDPCTEQEYKRVIRLYSQFSGNYTTETLQESGNEELRSYYNGQQIAARAIFPND